VTVPDTALGALLEEGYLAGELDVLALEVGERLFGSSIGVLANGTLALGFAHVDRSGLVYAAPGGLVVN